MNDEIRARIERMIGKGPLAVMNDRNGFWIAKGDFEEWRMELVNRIVKDAHIAADSLYTWIELDVQKKVLGVSVEELARQLRSSGLIESCVLADRLEREGVRGEK